MADLDRYQRQTLLPQIGQAGQARLLRARVLLAGCGALGTVVAEQFVRCGVGTLRIADRDIVELSNLQRQVLFDEEDAREQAPKAIAAARRLRRINSQIAVEPLVVDIHAANVEDLVGVERAQEPVDLIVDGTDNVQTRYLLNDVSVKHQIPWIYGGCVGMQGRCMTISPPNTACLRCLFSQPPAAGDLPTCDTAGVFSAAAGMVAQLQVTAAMKILLGHLVSKEIVTIDLWQGRFRSVSTINSKRPDCITCGRRQFEFLDDHSASRSTGLCGRNAVQVHPGGSLSLDLKLLANKLCNVGAVCRTPYLLRCDLREPSEVRLTVFPDGRAIIHGLSDIDRARSIYARYIGS